MSDRWQIDGRLAGPLAGRRFIPVIIAGVVLIAAGGLVLWATRSDGTAVIAPSAAAAAPNDLAERTRDIELTQQQAVDQLQIVQDQLAAQQAETQKLVSQIEALNEKLDALQQSVSNMPAPSGASSIALPKLAHKGRN